MIIKYRNHTFKNVNTVVIDCLGDLEAFARQKMGDVILSEEDDGSFWIYNYSETTESRVFDREYLIDAVLALFNGQDEYILVETSGLDR